VQDVNAPDVDPVEVRRTIGMVFQRPNPFPTARATRPIAFAAAPDGPRSGVDVMTLNVRQQSA
jgi:ABC-type phosphate transport system ATPase subunit